MDPNELSKQPPKTLQEWDYAQYVFVRRGWYTIAMTGIAAEGFAAADNLYKTFMHHPATQDVLHNPDVLLLTFGATCLAFGITGVAIEDRNYVKRWVKAPPDNKLSL